MNTRTELAVLELQSALLAEYRLTVAGRGLAEAEFASLKSQAAVESVRHWQDKVRVMEDARVAVSRVRQALEAV